MAVVRRREFGRAGVGRQWQRRDAVMLLRGGVEFHSVLQRLAASRGRRREVVRR